MTWPLLLDYSRDDCKRMLRKLELEAYASMITAFRAQGDLTKEKKKILQELSSMLSISLERHRAEIRRAVNDEKLNTIADRMMGPNTEMEWATEGRRLVPLMPRLVPQTAFTALANNLANIQAAKNAAMPEPSATGIKTDPLLLEELTPQKGRKRSLSSESQVSPSKIPFLLSPSSTAGQQSPPAQTPLLSPPIVSSPHPHLPTLSLPISTITNSTPSSFAHGSTMTPQIVPSSGKLPIRGGQQRSIAPAGSTPTHTPGKQVILVSGSTSNIPPSILQRCLSVPIAKGMTNTGSAPGTVLLGKNTITTTPSVNPITVTSPANLSSSIGSVVGGNMVVYTTTTRARPSKTPNTGTRQHVMRPRGSGLMSSPLHSQPPQQSGVMGMNTALQCPTLIGGQNKGIIRGPTGMSKGPRGPSLSAVRMDSPSSVVMKPVTQSISPHSTRILPKPITKSALTSGNILMSPSSSSSPQIMVVGGNTAKTSAQASSSSPRIVNVMSVTQPPVRQPPANTYASIGSKASRLAKVAASTTTTGSPGAKPNVIVVHKAHAWPQTTQQQQIKMVHPKDITSPSKVQILKKSEIRTIMSPAKGAKMGGNDDSLSPVKRSIVTSVTSTELDPTQLDPKNTVLADIIQATLITDTQTVTAGTIKKIQQTSDTLPSLSPLLSASPPPSSTSLVVNTSSPIKSAAENTTISSSPSKTVTKSDAIGFKVPTKTSNISEKGIQEILKGATAEADSSSVVEQDLETMNEQEIETSVSFQDIPLMEHLHEGQVLEIQAPEAANLLNSSGQLSKEVLALLQHVGIQLNQDQVTLDTSALREAGVEIELPSQDGAEGVSLEGEVQLDPVTGMLYLQQSDDHQETDLNSVVEVINAEGLGTGSVDLGSIRIVQETEKENLDIVTKDKLILEGDSSSIITVSSEPMELEDPFQNLAVGECVTVTIDNGGDGSSVEIGSEMETVISGECIEGELITESTEVEIN